MTHDPAFGTRPQSGAHVPDGFSDGRSLTGDALLTDIVQLAAALLQMPAARLTLVTTDDRWVAASVGLPADDVAHDTPFTDQVLSSNAPVVVPDTLADAGFASSPHRTGPSPVRFYAGVPVRHAGELRGVLAVLDRVPRTVAADDLEHLARLARQVDARLTQHAQAQTLRRADPDAEARLRRLTAHLEAAQRIAKVGSWENRLQQNRITWSDEIYRIFGISPDDFAATFDAFFERIHPDDRAAMLAAHQAAVTGQAPLDIEHRIVHPDGTVRYVRERGELLLDGDEPILAGTVQDITEQVRAEQALLRTQRIESIGTLAGGIAHDINNVLTPIVMAAGMLAATARDQTEAELLATISSSAERGAAMVRQVLSFARGVEGRQRPLHVEAVVADIGKLIRDTFDRRLHVEITTAPDLWMVLGDATQLHQVLLNLAVNARDAMPDGGRLGISVSNVDVPRHDNPLPPEVSAGRYVAIQVSDTGIGIPPTIHARVFDPFFTTKPHGRGTGLGLSTVQTLVRGHGGFLTLESDVGTGTTFTVLLPALDAFDVDAREDDLASAAAGEGRLVLVVDDESAVRMVTRATLEMFGYRVVVAEHGAEALALFEERADEIAAVVTDMMMPVMDGYTLIEALRQARPSLPIVAASGLETMGMAERVAQAGVRHFLPKPYSSETLLHALANALAGA